MKKKFQKILIMGLSGTGKTYLSEKLAKLINATHLNADEIRAKFNDWDFSPEGRLRQSKRMLELANQHKETQHVIADFICPTNETRATFNPDITIWMNTKSSSQYTDTDKIFEIPQNVDYTISVFGTCDVQAQLLAKQILELNWNNQAPTVQLLGRWQPWHEGHRALFDRAFTKTGQVCIMLRDLKDENNPFTIEERIKLIEENLSDLYLHKRDYIVLPVPNITNITYGRDVGYIIEQEVFNDEIHNISATEIRKKLKK